MRGLPEDERSATVSRFKDALKTPDGQKPLADDVQRKKEVFSMTIGEVKGLGDGSEKGREQKNFSVADLQIDIEGFFNLLYAHLFDLYPPGSPELQDFLAKLLQAISSAPSEQTFIRYRL